MPKSKSTRTWKHAKGLESPTSPTDWRAYVRKPKGLPCPYGTHQAPAYNKYKPSSRYCTRDCNAWSPVGTKKQGKGGRCYTPSQRPRNINAWQTVMTETRARAAPWLKTLDGVEKRDAMKELMVKAGKIYTRILGKGATMSQYKAKRAEISSAIAKMLR